MQLKRLAGLCAVLALAGCPSMSSGPSLGGSWREVGLSQNGNMRYEIDTSSIRKEGSRVRVRERMTVTDVGREHDVNTPHFKPAVPQWQFDCQARTRRLAAVDMWDASGNKLAANQYDTARRPVQPVVKGSAGGKQFEIACGRTF